MKDLETQERVLRLLQIHIALEYWKSGLPQGEIAKRLGMSKTLVNEFLKGLKRPNPSDRS